MRILLLCKYGPAGPSSRIRFFQYLPHLARRGIAVETSSLLGDGYLRAMFAGRRGLGHALAGFLGRTAALLRSGRFDLVWVEGELFPFLPAWGERLLAGRGTPLVVDLDDAVFHKYDLSPSALARSLLGRKMEAVVRSARLVVAGNRYIADYAARAGARRVEILPSVVDLGRYPAERGKNGAGFVVGWIGTPWTSRYLGLVGGPLAEVCAGGRGRIVLVGAGRDALPGAPVERVPWSEQTEVSSLTSFDAGIMPLPDTPWERGKCGYKLIQYMACRLPVVASPVGANPGILRGRAGFLASSDGEWVRALSALRDDPALREAMGAEGRRIVEADYSLDLAAPRLADLLSGVPSGG